MAKATVGGLRSLASRADAAKEPGQIELPAQKADRFQFISRNAALRLSLKRRIVRYMPDGEKIEEIPNTKMGNPLDVVAFEENYFETEDPEVAEAICKKEGYGVGREFWLLEDQKKALDEAEEREIRARLQAKPHLLERVLRPSDSASFELPKPPA